MQDQHNSWLDPACKRRVPDGGLLLIRVPGGSPRLLALIPGVSGFYYWVSLDTSEEDTVRPGQDSVP